MSKRHQLLSPAQIELLIEALEISPDHGLSIHDWAALLLALPPHEYRNPPPPATVCVSEKRKDRVQVLTDRMAAGVGLWHPGDTIQYEYPDMYGRPWDKIWREYFEQGMSGKPDDDPESLFDFSKK